MSVCETVYMQNVIENVVYQDMADMLSNAPLIKLTINKKDVTGMIASLSKCDCNERQFVSDYTEFKYFMYSNYYDLKLKLEKIMKKEKK